MLLREEMLANFVSNKIFEWLFFAIVFWFSRYCMSQPLINQWCCSSEAQTSEWKMMGIRTNHFTNCNQKLKHIYVRQKDSLCLTESSMEYECSYWKHIFSFLEVDSEWTVTRKIKVLAVGDGIWSSVFCRKYIKEY